MENALKSGVNSVPTENMQQEAVKSQPVKPIDPDFRKMKPSDFKYIEDWNNIVEQVNEQVPAIGCFLKKSKAYVCSNVMLLIVDNDFYLKKFRESSDASVLNEILKKNYGQTFNIKVKSAKNVLPEDTDNPINQLLDKAKKLDIEVEIKK